MLTSKHKGNLLKKAVASIPSSWYYDVSHYQRELQDIWYKNWIYICPKSYLIEPLSYRVIRVGGQSVILICDQDLNLKAYANTCRHRGAELLADPLGKLKTNTIVCPYHQWCYSVSTGALKGTSSMTEPMGFEKSDFGLKAIQIHVWRGLVFINLDSEASWCSEEIFQSYEPNIVDYPLERMVHAYTWRKEIKCNWKVYWENYSECLHCPNIHPELSSLVPAYARRLMDAKDPPNWQDYLESGDPKYVHGLKADAETWSMDGSAQGHAVDNLGTDFRGQSYSTTWPSMFLGAYADHFRTVRLLPIDSVTTELVADWFFPEEALSDPTYDQSNVTDFAILVMEQDGSACELNQRGLSSHLFNQGVLMPEEYTIHNFHRWLRKNLC